jgi:excisionase family DNA binding protein
MNAPCRGPQGAQGALAASLGDAALVAGANLWDLRALIREELAELIGERMQARLLTTVDLAEHLKVSERTVRALRAKGLPTLMVGDSPRFELGAVHAWLAEHGK